MIVRADARRIPLVDGSVQCVVSSPPYWGLRDYQTGRWDGGAEGCNHLVTSQLVSNKSGLSTGIPYRDICGKCGARRIDNQIGLERSIAEYVETMVAVFREVWRVLRDDGVVWVNFGDSYSSGGRTQVAPTLRTANHDPASGKQAYLQNFTVRPGRDESLKPKDVCGIPWRVAFALQTDGWYLRSDIIWAKPNPMPESVTDRPTRSHEYIFLFSKYERYFYDAIAIQERSVSDHPSGNGYKRDARLTYRDRSGARGDDKQWQIQAARNKRSVWTINSEPYPESHFATFPKKLVEPCVLAGSRMGDLVFDPFLGSGTVGEVCESLGRRWVGTDLSFDYLKMAQRRTAQRGLFA